MKTCRNCGATNSADDRFCGNCGAALPEQEDQQPRAQGEQTSPAQSEVKGNEPLSQPAVGASQPPYGAPGQQPSANDPYGSQTGGSYGQPPEGQYGQPAGNPYGQPPQDQSYGQPGGNPYGQHPGYGQQPQYDQQLQYDQQGQPYGSQPQGPYGPPSGDPYGDQTPQPWYATGSGSATTTPPPVRGRGRSTWKTAILIIVGLILLVCIGSIIFAVTPYGSHQVERLGTWAAEESTRQAGGQ